MPCSAPNQANGKHNIHTAGKADVFAEVANGKVVGVSAAGMYVKKVKRARSLRCLSAHRA